MITKSDVLNARLLVVDDEPANVRLLERMLKDAGYKNVTTTVASLEVRALHAAKPYDLILLDLHMPFLDGFQVMDQLKELETGGYLPVLALTAQPGHKLRALQAGAKDFVSKPFELPEVLARVHNLVEVRLLHQRAREHAKTLESMALHDALTGLANRRLLGERMELALAQARIAGTSVAVMYLDLDGFKTINDTHGHAVGDQLLQEVGRRLMAAVRKQDTVGRLGGDEFMVGLWEVTNDAAAALVAQKLIAALARPYALAGQTVVVTASAGVAVFPDAGSTLGGLMEQADAALYLAKHAGKNAFRMARTLGASDGPPDGPADPRGERPRRRALDQAG